MMNPMLIDQKESDLAFRVVVFGVVANETKLMRSFPFDHVSEGPLCLGDFEKINRENMFRGRSRSSESKIPRVHFVRKSSSYEYSPGWKSIIV